MFIQVKFLDLRLVKITKVGRDCRKMRFCEFVAIEFQIFQKLFRDITLLGQFQNIFY